jgi:hypothetical protein
MAPGLLVRMAGLEGMERRRCHREAPLMAERVLFRCALSGFIPFNEEGQEFFARCKLGEVVELQGRRVRNERFHRLFWAMLKLISDNSNPHISPRAALHFAKIATGTGDVVTDSRGETHFIPGSISFAKMDEIEFQAFVKTAIPPLVGRFMVGSAPRQVIEEAMSLAA